MKSIDIDGNQNSDEGITVFNPSKGELSNIYTGSIYSDPSLNKDKRTFVSVKDYT